MSHLRTSEVLQRLLEAWSQAQGATEAPDLTEHLDNDADEQLICELVRADVLERHKRGFDWSVETYRQRLSHERINPESPAGEMLVALEVALRGQTRAEMQGALPESWHALIDRIHSRAEQLAGEQTGRTVLPGEASGAGGVDPAPEVDSDTRIGGYVIEGELGRGGMGIVLRARDERLGRPVAIKTLPTEGATNARGHMRFEREARLLANLDHPNIANVYGLEHDGEKPYLVMELVEGQTLRDRLARGRLRVEEALDVIAQAAAGIEAAHDNGVIHRDIKPGNIMIRPDGTVKVLDFGLARAFELGDEAQTVTSDRGATVTTKGQIVGTPFYMSPEQARGKPVDRRTDVWALATVLYECLTSSRPFEGGTVSDVIAAIIERDPDWTALPSRTPPRICDLLERCLHKDVKRRQRDVGDMRIEIEASLQKREWSASAEMPHFRVRRRLAGWVWSIATAGACTSFFVALVWMGVVARSEPTAQERVAAAPQYVDVQDPDYRFAWYEYPTLDISPDGRFLAYFSGDSPYSFGRTREDEEGESIPRGVRVRDLGLPSSEATRLDAPKGLAYHLTTPLFAPDGKTLYRMYVLGGVFRQNIAATSEPVVVNESLNHMKGASWGDDRSLVISPHIRTALHSLDVHTGELTPLTTLESGEASHRWPDVLPGGRYVLFTVKRDNPTNFHDTEVHFLDLETNSRKRLGVTGCAKYVDSGEGWGHVVWASAGKLAARPFDPSQGEWLGAGKVVLEHVVTDETSGSAQFAIARDAGHLVYVHGDPWLPQSRIGRFSMESGFEAWTHLDNLAPAYFLTARLSKEAGRIALTTIGAQQSLALLYEGDGRFGGATLAVNGNVGHPVWCPDGSLIYFSDAGELPGNVFRRDWLDGRKVDLLEPEIYPLETLTLEGQDWLIYTRGATPRNHIWTAPYADRISSQRQFHVGPFRALALRGDCGWVAFHVNTTGLDMVHVHHIPSQTDLEPQPGSSPIWSADGRSLFIRDYALNRVVRFHFDPDASPEPALTRQDGFVNIDPSIRLYDPLPDQDDGPGFLALHVKEMPESRRIVAILNWRDELRRLAPRESE